MSWDDWDDWDDHNQDEERNKRECTRRAEIVGMFKEFQLSVCDERVFSAFNKTMNTATSERFRRMRDYYERNPVSVCQQTLLDIRRNPFTVHIADSSETTITDVGGIEDLHTLHHERNSTSAERLLWAFASQTLWSEMLVSVTREYLAACVDLSLALISVGTTFSLHFGNSGSCTLSTTSTLSFSTTACSMQGGGLEKLELASLDATISVSVLDGGATGTVELDLHTPRLLPVFDADLERAASSILALSDSNSNDEDRFQRHGVNIQTARLTRHVASTLSQFAREVTAGLSGIGGEVAADLPSLDGGVEGLVRSFSSLVGGGKEGQKSGEDCTLGMLRNELAASLITNKHQQQSTLSASQEDLPQQQTGGGLQGLFDGIAEDGGGNFGCEIRGKGRGGGVLEHKDGGLWGGWFSRSIVRGIGEIVDAGHTISDEDFTLYRRDNTATSSVTIAPAPVPAVESP